MGERGRIQGLNELFVLVMSKSDCTGPCYTASSVVVFVFSF